MRATLAWEVRQKRCLECLGLNLLGPFFIRRTNYPNVAAKKQLAFFTQTLDSVRE